MRYSASLEISCLKNYILCGHKTVFLSSVLHTREARNEADAAINDIY